MVDPGAIGILSTPGPTRHWLVNGVTIGADGSLSIPPNTSAITAYGGRNNRFLRSFKPKH